VINWLVRKPGAFANYRYRDELFPTSRFRQAYDWLLAASPLQAAREYLRILEQAALGSEERVDAALQQLLAAERSLSAEAVATVVDGAEGPATITDVHITAVDLESYDGLLGAVVRGGREEARCVAAAI